MSIYGTIKFIVLNLFRILYRLKRYGLEDGHEKAVILAGNHSSFLDPCVISICWPDDVHFFAKKELFNGGFLGWLIRKLNTHPLNIRASNLESMKLIAQLLKEGKEIVLFPEGTRSFDGELMEGQPGVAMFAMHADCPIVPTYIHGTYDAFPRGRKFPKLFGKMACVYGKPIHPKNYRHLAKKEARRLMTEDVMNTIAALKKWYLAGAKGPLPSISDSP